MGTRVRWLAGAALAALAGGAAMWRIDKWRIESRDAEIARLTTALAAQTAAAATSTPAPAQPLPPATTPGPAPAPVQRLSVDDPVTRNELVKLLNEKNEQIAEAKTNAARLDARIEELEAKIAAASADSARLAAAERELTEKLNLAERLAESHRAEATGRHDRVTRLETENLQLRKRADDAVSRLKNFARPTQELEDLSRRREQYLTNILRRYREVTDMYRSVAAHTDNASSDLSRVQSAIALAEDDLRQLMAINAQAARLERDLAAARRQ